MSEGLAFWTDDGTPGIQVRPDCFPTFRRQGLTSVTGRTLEPPSRGPESRFGPNHVSRFILWWIVLDRSGIDALGMWNLACL